MIYLNQKGGIDMKTKKIIIVCLFLALITITGICTIAEAVKSYNYDMDPANGVDLLEGLGAVLALVIGGFVILYELDLFYTVYYFFIKSKTIVRSIINVLANVSLLLVFFGEYVAKALSISEEAIFIVALFGIYVFLRLIYFMISMFSLLREDLKNNN